MCHGPSAQHAVEMAESQYYSKAPLDPPVNFRELGNREFVAICAQCHEQSAIRKPGATGELNYSHYGDFFLSHVNVPFGEFSRKGFYKDGRFRQTTFMVEALERSQCFRKGQVSCGTCHDPHGHDSGSNPTALEVPRQAGSHVHGMPYPVPGSRPRGTTLTSPSGIGRQPLRLLSHAAHYGCTCLSSPHPAY